MIQSLEILSYTLLFFLVLGLLVLAVIWSSEHWR
jgi:hypothetical protein